MARARQRARQAKRRQVAALQLAVRHHPQLPFRVLVHAEADSVLDAVARRSARQRTRGRRPPRRCVPGGGVAAHTGIEPRLTPTLLPRAQTAEAKRSEDQAAARSSALAVEMFRRVASEVYVGIAALLRPEEAYSGKDLLTLVRRTFKEKTKQVESSSSANAAAGSEGGGRPAESVAQGVAAAEQPAAEAVPEPESADADARREAAGDEEADDESETDEEDEEDEEEEEESSEASTFDDD